MVETTTETNVAGEANVAAWKEDVSLIVQKDVRRVGFLVKHEKVTDQAIGGLRKD
jgi:hypothetical protein